MWISLQLVISYWQFCFYLFREREITFSTEYYKNIYGELMSIKTTSKKKQNKQIKIYKIKNKNQQTNTIQQTKETF